MSGAVAAFVDGRRAVSGEAEARLLRCLHRALANDAAALTATQQAHRASLFRPLTFAALTHGAVALCEALDAREIGVAAVAAAQQLSAIGAAFVRCALVCAAGSGGDAPRVARGAATATAAAAAAAEEEEEAEGECDRREWRAIAETHGARAELLRAGSLVLLWRDAVAPALSVLGSSRVMAGAQSGALPLRVGGPRVALRAAAARVITAAAAVPAAAAPAAPELAAELAAARSRREREAHGGGARGEARSVFREVLSEAGLDGRESLRLGGTRELVHVEAGAPLNKALAPLRFDREELALGAGPGIRIERLTGPGVADRVVGRNQLALAAGRPAPGRDHGLRA